MYAKGSLSQNRFNVIGPIKRKYDTLPKRGHDIMITIDAELQNMVKSYCQQTWRQ